MTSDILYDDINLPEKVSDILQHDFWMMRHVNKMMAATVTNPVKFSAFTSIFVSKGEAQADINLITYDIKAPCVINIAHGDIILPRTISPDFEASFVVFSPKLTRDITEPVRDTPLLAKATGKPVVALSPASSVVLEKFYDELQDISTDPSIQLPYETLLYALIAFFLRYSARYYQEQPQDLNNSSHQRISDRFIRLVQAHFRTERFLDYYAARLEITPKHLSRLIRQQTGMRAVEWINRHIILEAQVMLRSSNLTVQQIAEQLNFSTQSSFGKYFKKATGISPKDFRNSFS